MRNRNPRRSWLLPAIIILAAALLRTGYLLVYARQLPFFAHPFGDAEVYLTWARQIAAGEAATQAVFYRAPLYPYMLALLLKLTASRLLAVYVLQALLGLGTLSVVYVTALRLFSRRAAIIALALAALSTPLIFFESKLLSATVVVFLTSLGMLLVALAADRRRRWLWLPAGLIFGAAALAWAGALIVFVVLCVWALAGKEAGRKALPLGIIGCLAVMSIVTIRNALVGNNFVPISANAGFTFYQGNNRLAAGTLAQPPEVYEFRYDGRHLTEIAEQERFERLYVESRLGRTTAASVISGFWFRRALGWIARNPGAYLLLQGRKLVLALSDYESPSDYSLDLEVIHVWPLRLAFVRFGLLLALAVVGVWLARPRQAWPVYAVALGTLAALLTFYVADRYRLPAFPALAVLAGAGVAELWRKARDRKLRAAPVAAGVLALLLSVAAFTLPLRRGSNLLLANAYRNLGAVYQYRTEDRARAESAYGRSVAIQEANADPASLPERSALEQTRTALERLRPVQGMGGLRPEAAGLLDSATASLARADTVAAVAELEAVLASDSLARQAYLVLGSILGTRRQHAAAQQLLARANRHLPRDPVLLYNLAVAALKAGDSRAALASADAVLSLAPGHPLATRVAAQARRNLAEKK